MASDILPSRYGFFAGCIVVTAAAVERWLHTDLVWWLVLALLAGALSVVGVADVAQKRQAIRRNYPVLAHIRFFLEFIRPEMKFAGLDQLKAQIAADGDAARTLLAAK